MLNNRKTIISPGQGLLILIDYYKNEPGKIESFKKVYLSGIQSEAAFVALQRLFEDKILAAYIISYDNTVINEDPTRRYFETHLAYETLKNGLSEMDIVYLASHSETVSQMLPEHMLKLVDDVVKGSIKEEYGNINREYADYFANLKGGKIFENFPQIDRNKIELLVKSCFFSIVNMCNHTFPLGIYETGIFSAKNRGNILIAGQENTRNLHFGLMKGHMPLALNDLAQSTMEKRYLKPSDKSTFNVKAMWAEVTFKQLMHPYSNSISGTVLSLLRVFAKIRNNNEQEFKDTFPKMIQYFKLIISAMLFNSGGHSLMEFVAPFMLDRVKKEFSSTPEFESISLMSLFYENNQISFDKALHDTIHYNKMVLFRRKVLSQIKGESPIRGLNNKPNLALQKLKFCFDKVNFIKNTSDKLLNYECRLTHQLFGLKRQGFQKNIFISTQFRNIESYLFAGKYEKALSEVKAVKQEIDIKFGKNNVWGNPCEVYKLVMSIEQDLLYLTNNILMQKVSSLHVQAYKEMIRPSH